MRLLSLALVAAFLLAGCICKSGPYVASDTADGAYDRLSGEYADQNKVTEKRPESKVPVANPELDARWGPRTYALARVGWDAPFMFSGPPSAGFQLSAEGNITAQFSTDFSESEIKEWFERFAVNVTSADARQREEWADAFVSNARASAWELDRDGNHERPVGFLYSIIVSGPFRVDALLQEWKTGEGWYESHHSAGEMRVFPMHGRSWSVGLVLATRTTHVRVDGYAVEATADVGDRVAIKVDHDGDLERTQRSELLREIYARLGWGTPSSEASLYGVNEDNWC